MIPFGAFSACVFFVAQQPDCDATLALRLTALQLSELPQRTAADLASPPSADWSEKSQTNMSLVILLWKATSATVAIQDLADLDDSCFREKKTHVKPACPQGAASSLQRRAKFQMAVLESVNNTTKHRHESFNWTPKS